VKHLREEEDSAQPPRGADSGLAAGGLASTEMERWKHVMGTSEYRREKKRTKEKRTSSLAANTCASQPAGQIDGQAGRQTDR
jgi:hypothetical protein